MKVYIIYMTTHKGVTAMKSLLKVSTMVSLLVALVALSGCGATFAKNGSAHLKGGETVGVLIPSFKVMKIGFVSNEHINEKVDAEAAGMMADQLREVLVNRGYNVKIIVVNDATADLVKRYMALPRNFRRVVSDPEAADLGNLHALFKENGIDQLVMLEGETNLRPNALGAFSDAAIRTGIALATGAVSSSAARPTSFTYTSSVTPEGKFSFYNREQFTKNGDFLYYPDRKAMAEHAVDGWLAASR